MRKDIYKAVAKHFDYRGADSFFDVVADLVDRVDFGDWQINAEDDYDIIWSAIDEGLIYTRDQWAVLEHYCTPSDANFDEAIEELATDMNEIIADLVYGDAD